MSNQLPCDDGGGSINNPNNPETPILPPYTPPNTCIGDWEMTGTGDECENNEQTLQDSYAAENLNINGAPINVFKLLGIHEQGIGSIINLVNLTSSPPQPGYPVTGLQSNTEWRSIVTGSDVVTSPAWIAIDFGLNTLPPVSAPATAPRQYKYQSVGSISITQANNVNNAVRQVRVERTLGDVTLSAPLYTGTGNGALTSIAIGPEPRPSTITVTAISATQFLVTEMTSTGSFNLGVATVGVPFRSLRIWFTITGGAVPFVTGDFWSIVSDWVWQRVGVWNLPVATTPTVLNFNKQITAIALRIVPTLFTGTGNWIVTKLDVTDDIPTDINNVQDLFFQENRDRDYSKEPILLKCQYNPIDSMGDLSKFGIQLMDQYAFTVSFSQMVSSLGRPIVVGDVIEVTPELAYDHNLKPIRKFLEVTDASWASEGFSTHWKPVLYRFTGQQALPRQETRDIFGTIDTQRYLIDDSVLASAGQQIDVSPLEVQDDIIAKSRIDVPETGDNIALTVDTVPPVEKFNPINPKGQPEGFVGGVQGKFIRDGLPPNGEPYQEGYKLPDPSTAVDGQWFRLLYPESTNIPARLHQFSMVKNRWIFKEQDERGKYSSHRKTVDSILSSNNKKPLR